MILRTSVKAVIQPEALHQQCTKAEHAVAVQAERDCRPFIPGTGRLRNCGRVYGRTITLSSLVQSLAAHILNVLFAQI